MGAQLNIKNDVARRLAEEIAGITGASITQVVTDALTTRLQDVRREQAREPGARRTREQAFYAIVDGCRPRWHDYVGSIDHADILYDEYGLPR